MQISNGAIAFLKIILFLVITGAIGFGIFCGGLAALFLIPGVGIIIAVAILVVGIMLWLFLSKRLFAWGGSKNTTNQFQQITSTAPNNKSVPKQIIPAVSYISQAKIFGYDDAFISNNLITAGWTKSDIEQAFNYFYT